MLEWLRELIEQAKINEGKIEVDSLMESIKKAFPEHAVPKTEFNDLNSKLKDANKALTDLKKANEGNESLQTTIKDYEAKIKDLETKAVMREKEIAVVNALKDAGALDPDYLIFKMGGLDKVEMDGDGKVKDLSGLIKTSKEQYPIAFKPETHEDPNKKATDPKDPNPGKPNLQKIVEKGLSGGSGDPGPAVNSLSDALSAHYKK